MYHQKNNQMKNTFILLAFLLLSGCGNVLQIHVSPDGNDNNNGSIKSPLASIEKAVIMIERNKHDRGASGTIEVLIHEGKYRISEGITLNNINNNPTDGKVLFKAYKSQKVIISGSVKLEKYIPIAKSPQKDKFSPDVVPNIVEFDLEAAGIKDFKPIRLSGFNGTNPVVSYTLRELFLDGKPMPISRWPNKGFSKFGNVETKTMGDEIIYGITFDNEKLYEWVNEPNIVLHGYWKYLWADAYEHVDYIDAGKKIIWLKPPYNNYKFKSNNPFAALNIISEMDNPGEWTYDFKNKKIYFYVPHDISNSEIDLSVCETPLLSVENSYNIDFSGLIFEMGSAEGISLKNSTNCNVSNCIVRDCARDGIIVDGGHNIQITSSEIYDCGRGGIKLAGGNRETLVKSEFLIHNCHIHDLSRIDRTYTPGIWVDGVGTHISNCNIHDVPSSAMRINGNDHLVEYNEMYNVVTESDDQGAIDMWGDPTFQGNIFRYNYFHDVGPKQKDEIEAHTGRAGIRFDDAISGNIIYGNIFDNCSGGLFGAVQIHGGKENVIKNNIFHNCSIGVSFTPWSTEKWLKITKDKKEILNKSKGLYLKRYPELVHIDENLNFNLVESNIFIQCENTTARKPDVVKLVNNLVTDTDPGFNFKDMGKQNFFMPERNAELKKIGFEKIPFDKIGINSD